MLKTLAAYLNSASNGFNASELWRIHLFYYDTHTIIIVVN